MAQLPAIVGLTPNASRLDAPGSGERDDQRAQRESRSQCSNEFAVILEGKEPRALGRDLQDAGGLRDHATATTTSVALILLASTSTESVPDLGQRDHGPGSNGHGLAAHVLDARAGREAITHGL